MLRAILNKSWRQHPTRHQLYGHLPPITKTIQVRWTRHAGHCWRSKDKLISDVLLWTPAYGQAKAGRPARTYIQQLFEDMGCNPEYLPEAMNNREKWRERVKDIRAGGTTWWWWWVLSSFNFLHNSQLINFPHQVVSSWQPSLLMRLIVSSLSPHNLHWLFRFVLSIFALTWLVLIALFWAAIKRDSVFL